MYHNKKCRSVLYLAACLALVVIGIGQVRADTLDQLYGLTSDGVLYRIDKASGKAGQIRKQLPTTYSNFQALAYKDGYFYAAYGSGKIMKFGFDDGDDVDIGNSGFYVVKALAFNSSGVLYAAGSLDQDGSPESVATINLSTGAAGTTVSTARASYFSNVVDDIEGMAFKSNGALYVLFVEASGQNSWAQFDLTTGVTTPGPTSCSGCLGYFEGYGRHFRDVAIDPTTGNIYGTAWQPAQLWALTETGSSPSFTLSTTSIGVLGYDPYSVNPVMTGLTFGPKPPPRAIEPIQRLILN